MLLDLSAAFDIVDHPNLLHCLPSVFGIQDQALAWVESYLHQQFFSDYLVPLAEVFEKWNILYHSYADDTQVYISFSPDSDEIEACQELESCLANVRQVRLGSI